MSDRNLSRRELARLGLSGVAATVFASIRAVDVVHAASAEGRSIEQDVPVPRDRALTRAIDNRHVAATSWFVIAGQAGNLFQLGGRRDRDRDRDD